jgi:tetratricopeptide (TPR) repeat protein
MITVKNYREATLDLKIPNELQAGHEYTLSYLDLYECKRSLAEANKILKELKRPELPYNIEISEVIDAHIASLNAAIDSSKSKAKPTKKTSTQNPEIAEWQEAIDALKELIEIGGTYSEIAEWQEAIDALKELIDMESGSMGRLPTFRY